MSSQNTTMKIGGVQDSPLQLFQPMNIIVFLSFFSPVILATSITGMSFILSPKVVAIYNVENKIFNLRILF